MGLILDSSILIARERGGESVRAILKRVQATQAATVVELTHGIYRAKTDTYRERWRAFTEELCRDLTVHPVTLEIAQLAGKVESEQAARGISIAFEDLLIGTTALQLGYSVATLNVRHFRLIPGLSVIQLWRIWPQTKLPSALAAVEGQAGERGSPMVALDCGKSKWNTITATPPQCSPTAIAVK